MEQEREILTIAQVAEFLQISEVTTYKLVQEGRIPGFKIGRHWRVKKEDLREHISKLQHGDQL
ncbi:helix-turn-helix domain-containing protein [Halobacillus campisalis]|uniref:Helix-turn-helix domain-containing protein n=1 Tax=Halobacillus campisalis TaxID=435909 RepID=A0ABW2K5T9_9BACI|nr:helix-turn-helix domain-containing protein [Halobacillus campisalis]